MSKHSNFKLGALVLIALLSFLSLFLYFINILSPSKTIGSWNFIKEIFISFIFMLGITYVDYKLVVFIHKANRINKNLWVRIFFEVFFLSVFACIFVFLGNIPFKYSQGVFNYLVSTDFLQALIASILLNIFTVTMIEFFFQYQKTKSNEIKYQQLQTDIAQMQYRQLKGQINPHFLFNGLNVLVSLINKDSDRAIDYTKKLSLVYRYVLSYDSLDVITLRDEIAFIYNYIDILKIRFDKGLLFVINIEDSYLDYQIAPLTLQLLIENAIKHNVVSASKPLSIQISVENGFIVVVNNINSRSSIEDSTGIGLKNLQGKYRILTDVNIHIASNGSEFIVHIPIL